VRRAKSSLVTMLLVGVTAMGLSVAAAFPAAAQSADTAAADLRTNDVTFETNAVSSTQLNQLDAAAARVQSPDGYFKVVVLADPVSDYNNTAAYAAAVRGAIGGRGRVLVYTPDDLAISSNVDTSAQVLAAEQAARGAANRTQSFAQGVLAAQQSLGTPAASSSGGNTGGGSTVPAGGGSGVAIVIFLVVAAAAVLGVVWWMRRSRRKTEQKATAARATEGELKVRERVDHAGTLVLELTDRVELPDAPPRAKELFQQGAVAFAGYQEELDAADTVPELEAVYPKVVQAAWLLDSSKAVLDGQPEPAPPVPEALFPAPPPAPAQAPIGAPAGSTMIGPELLQPVPQRSYQDMSVSPWLTAAAAAALTMLASRGGSAPTRHRPPARDNDLFGAGSPINIGDGGRGMGSRSGGRRGMGRR
jgi:flagellar basal body-associated protein FliL